MALWFNSRILTELGFSSEAKGTTGGKQGTRLGRWSEKTVAWRLDEMGGEMDGRLAVMRKGRLAQDLRWVIC